MTSLSRVVGTHMTLLGMLSTSLMPSAAFAAVDSKTASLVVNVNSVMTLTVGSPAAFNGLVPNGAQQKADAAITVATNAFQGYNITAKGSNLGTGGCTTQVLCSTETGLTTIPITDVATRYTGTGLAAGLGTENGLVFRIRSSATGSTDTVSRWGTDTTTEKFAAFPVGTALTVLTKSGDASGSMATAHNIPVTYGIKVPGSQMEGGYAGTITYTATSI